MNDLEDIKINSYLALISNPKTKSLINEALKSPLGSSKRKAATLLMDNFKKWYTNNVFSSKPELKEEYIRRKQESMMGSKDGKGGPMTPTNIMQGGTTSAPLSTGPRITTPVKTQVTPAPQLVLSSSAIWPETYKDSSLLSKWGGRQDAPKIKQPVEDISVGKIFGDLFQKTFGQSTMSNLFSVPSMPDTPTRPWSLKAPLLPGITFKDGKVTQIQPTVPTWEIKQEKAGTTQEPSDWFVKEYRNSNVDLSVQNNNPLNIKVPATDWTWNLYKTAGLDPRDSWLQSSDKEWTFLAFKTPEDGLKAASLLLTNSGYYKDKTLDEAMRTWSANGYNAQKILQFAPTLDVNKKIKDYSPEELKSLMNSMAINEWYYRVDPNTWKIIKPSIYTRGQDNNIAWDGTSDHVPVWSSITKSDTGYTFKNPTLALQYASLSDEAKSMFWPLYEAADNGMGEKYATRLIMQSKEVLKQMFPDLSEEALDAMTAAPSMTTKWGTIAPTLQAKKELESLEDQLNRFDELYGGADASILRANLDDYVAKKDTYLRDIKDIKRNTIANLSANPLYLNSGIMRATTDKYLNFLDTLEARQSKRYNDVLTSSVERYKAGYNTILGRYNKTKAAADAVLKNYDATKKELEDILKEQYNNLTNLESTALKNKETREKLYGTSGVDLSDADRKAVFSTLENVVGIVDPLSKDSDAQIRNLNSDIMEIIQSATSRNPNVQKNPVLLGTVLKDTLNSIYNIDYGRYLHDNDVDKKVKWWISQLFTLGQKEGYEQYLLIAKNLRDTYQDKYASQVINKITDLSEIDDNTKEKQTSQIVKLLANPAAWNSLNNQLGNAIMESGIYKLLEDGTADIDYTNAIKVAKKKGKIKDLTQALNKIGLDDANVDRVILGLMHALVSQKVWQDAISTNITGITGTANKDWAQGYNLNEVLGLTGNDTLETILKQIWGYLKEGIIWQKFGYQF